MNGYWKRLLITGGICLLIGGVAGHIGKGMLFHKDETVLEPTLVKEAFEAQRKELQKKILVPEKKKGMLDEGKSSLAKIEILKKVLKRNLTQEEYFSLFLEISDIGWGTYSYDGGSMAQSLLFEKWTAVSPRLAFERLNGNSSFSSEKEDLFFSAWATHDPQAAARYYVENMKEIAGDLVVERILEKWNSGDVEEIHAWLKEASPPVSEMLFLEYVAKNYPDRIGEYIQDFPDHIWEDPYSIHRWSDSIRTIVEAWYPREKNRLSEWIEALPEQVRPLVQGEYVRLLAEENINLALGEIDKLPETERREAGGKISMASLVKGTSSTEEALDRILKYRKDFSFYESLSPSFEKIVKNNLPEVKVYLEKMPKGRDRDILTAIYLANDSSLLETEKIKLTEAMESDLQVEYSMWEQEVHDGRIWSEAWQWSHDRNN